jgi:hypothetical protein
MILNNSKMQLISAVMAMVPGWKQIMRERESPKGAPRSWGLLWLKYQMDAADMRMKVLQPRKKKTSQNPLNRKATIRIIYVAGSAIIGKAMASGKVKLPKE